MFFFDLQREMSLLMGGMQISVFWWTFTKEILLSSTRIAIFCGFPVALHFRKYDHFQIMFGGSISSKNLKTHLLNVLGVWSIFWYQQPSEMGSGSGSGSLVRINQIQTTLIMHMLIVTCLYKYVYIIYIYIYIYLQRSKLVPKISETIQFQFFLLALKCCVLRLSFSNRGNLAQHSVDFLGSKTKTSYFFRFLSYLGSSFH